MSTHIVEVGPSSQPRLDVAARLVTLCLIGSSVAAVIGLIFLVVFFSGVRIFGPLNDIMVIIQYLLMIPVVVMVHRIIPANRKIRLTGYLGVIAVIVLQALLVLGVLPFQIQVLMVIPAFFMGAYWFAAIEKLGRDDPRLPKGRWKAIFAGLVFSYPWWAFDFKRRLNQTHPSESE